MGDVLNKDKKIFDAKKIYKQSRIAYLGYYLIALGILFLGFYFDWGKGFRITCIIIFAVIVLFLEIVLRRNRLTIDDTSVEMRIGIFNIIRKSIPLNMISDIRIKQNFLQNILRYGTLELNTGGGEFYEMNMHKLRHPVKVRDEIERRLHINK